MKTIKETATGPFMKDSDELKHVFYFVPNLK